MSQIIAMYTHSLFIRIALVSTLFSLGSEYVSACAIERWPTPELTKYIQQVYSDTAKIRDFSSAKNACPGTNGTFSNESRFVSLLSSIDAEVAITPRLFTDFQYRVLLVAGWESRWPVLNQGVIIQWLEGAPIITSLKNASSTCTLDTVMPGGSTPKIELSRIIRTNRALFAYYQDVAIGNPTLPDGIETSLLPLYKEIQANYSPDATATCVAASGVKTFEDLMKKIQDRLGQKWAQTAKAKDSWQEARDLLSGNPKNITKYKQLQERLLATELARQWLTQKARDAMLGKLSCVQAKTTPSDNSLDLGQANYDCKKQIITIADNVTNPFKKTILQAANIDEYLKRLTNYSRAKVRGTDDLVNFWKKLEAAKDGDEKLNTKMITDLVNMHASLTITNDLLKKKIPDMYKNCGKWGVGTRCPQP